MEIRNRPDIFKLDVFRLGMDWALRQFILGCSWFECWMLEALNWKWSWLIVDEPWSYTAVAWILLCQQTTIDRPCSSNLVRFSLASLASRPNFPRTWNSLSHSASFVIWLAIPHPLYWTFWMIFQNMFAQNNIQCLSTVKLNKFFF